MAQHSMNEEEAANEEDSKRRHEVDFSLRRSLTYDHRTIFLVVELLLGLK